MEYRSSPIPFNFGVRPDDVENGVPRSHTECGYGQALNRLDFIVLAQIQPMLTRIIFNREHIPAKFRELRRTLRALDTDRLVFFNPRDMRIGATANDSNVKAIEPGTYTLEPLRGKKMIESRREQSRLYAQRLRDGLVTPRGHQNNPHSRTTIVRRTSAWTNDTPSERP